MSPSPTPSTSASGTVTERDRTFIVTAAGGAQFEILAAELAGQRASNQEVQAFATRMVTDHSAGLAQLSQIAGDLGVTVPAQADPTALPPALQSILDVWNQLSGTGFDCSYAPAEYFDHQAAVTVFQDEATSGDDPTLRAFAVSQLGTLQSHFDQAGTDLTALSCATPSATPTATPSTSPTASPSASPMVTPSASPSVTPSGSPVPTVVPSLPTGVIPSTSATIPAPTILTGEAPAAPLP